MRSLVTIQEILDLEPIPGADFIELATVMGWKAIVKKGEYQVGDRCVYFEVDSFLPVEERFEFLRKGSYRNNEFMGPGFRIRTQKLRGCISQGLIMPLDVDEQLEGLEIGTDVTELLGVRKWELPEIEFGHSKDNGDFSLGPKPYGIPTTDELRVQSYGYLRTELIGKPYYITTKMDGTSMTVYHKDGEVGVCSRKLNLIDTGDSPYWSCARRYGLPDSLKELGRN